MKMHETNILKVFNSPDYNYVFNKKSGVFARWGKTKSEDPTHSPFGPEIIDIEISKAPCSGGNSKESGKSACSYCYKGNNVRKETHNMTLEQLQKIINKTLKIGNSFFLTQVALGICDVDTNPDFYPMLTWLYSVGIIPNYTTNGYKVDRIVAKYSAMFCGAVAVSYMHDNPDVTFDAVHEYTKAGMKQVNIHYLLSDETVGNIPNLVNTIKTDPRLKDLNAVVFLQYKPKGIRKDFHSVTSITKFQSIFKLFNEAEIGIGFDSCSSRPFLKSIEARSDYEAIKQVVEPCESFGLFSAYISSEGIYYPCSFCEGENGWKDGINIAEHEDFMEIWNGEELSKWRQRSLDDESKNICRGCLIFDELNKLNI